MKKPSIGIVVPFFNTPMWGQTSIYSLLTSLDTSFLSKYSVEVLVVDNVESKFPQKCFVDALKIFNNEDIKIRFIDNPEMPKFHGTALYIGVCELNTDYLLCWETDIVALKSDWLDWLLSFFEDSNLWGVGTNYGIHDGYNDFNYHIPIPDPGIYRMSILKEINKECQDNKEPVFYYGKDYKEFVKEDLQSKWGVFSERRGFKETHPNSPDGKEGKGIKYGAGGFLHGEWLAFRMLRDGRFHSTYIPQNVFMFEEDFIKYTSYGGDRIRHYWFGSSKWQFLMGEELNWVQIKTMRLRIEEEIKIWKMIVPKEYRKKVIELFNKIRNDKFQINNIKHIYNNKLYPEKPYIQELSLEISNWWKQEFLDTNFQNLL